MKKAMTASSLLIGLIAGPAFAQDYTIPSRAEFDQSFPGTTPGHIEAVTTEADANKYPFLWWRNTDNQNALWAHSQQDFTNQLITAYEDSASGVKVLVSNRTLGGNVVAIIGPSGNIIVGTGGSRNAARLALHALAQAVPNFQVDLRAIIYTNSNPEAMYGAQEFAGTNIERTAPLQIYGHAAILDVGAIKQATNIALLQRSLYFMGPEIPYGPNGNLGVGSFFSFNPYQPDNGLIIPNRFINSDTTVTLGGLSIRLIPNVSADAGLIVWLANQKVLIAGQLLGKYFPPLGALGGWNEHIPVTAWINALDNMNKLHADVLVPLHSLPITNATDVAKALTDLKNALTSVYTQTVAKINAMMPLDDIVASVSIPEPLAAQPYVQEFRGTVANAVRAIYHYYLGWFDFEPDSLDNRSALEKAMYLVDVAGGGQKALEKAGMYERSTDPRAWQEAIRICKALRMASPSHDADEIYIQALRKLGYSQKSGEVRNYYLLTALKVERTM